jgi:nickel-dependent lactate racemase
MLYFALENLDGSLSSEALRRGLTEALDHLGRRKKVLAVPPDITRLHSHAGPLTRMAWEYYRAALTDVLPAIGTHRPMTDAEISRMYPQMPPSLFRVHDWRKGIVTRGQVPADFIRQVSEGKVHYPWPAQVDRLIAEGGFDLILSIGQVVPHEVTGMANYNKNILVGTGGSEGINKSHYLGAVYGMERMMGRADTPVRRVLNYASDHFLKDLPIVYVLTVVDGGQGGPVVRGLFIGDGTECFERAAALSLKVNFTMLDAPLQKAVVYLDPAEYKSTWLGNKSIYRTRMAMADSGELIVLAPGLVEFGEDREIDRLIRKYGYVGTERVLSLVDQNEDLRANLSAAAHLIHGSSEGRFRVTYCPGGLSRQEIEAAGFAYGDLAQMMKKYDPQKRTDGFHAIDGQEVFFISNPGLGLWAFRDRFR